MAQNKNALKSSSFITRSYLYISKYFIQLPFALQATFAFATLGLAVYGTSLNNEFLLDDEEQIVNNRLTESLSYLGRIFSGASTGEGGSFNSYGVYFRPLMLALFMFLRITFGLDPFPFHLLQLTLHVGTAVLFALILRHFTANLVAILGAAVFLIHPMNTEAVSYIAALQDPLCAFFSLSCFYLVLRTPKLAVRHLPIIAALALLAILGKETAILYFFVTLLAWPFFRRANGWREFTLLSGTLGLSTAGYFALRAGLAGLTSVAHDSTQLARLGYEYRLLTLPAILASYLGKFFVPLRLATTQDWVVRSIEFDTFWLPLLFVLAVTLLCSWYALTRKNRLFCFFFIWSFAGLGFHSHLVTALDGTVAERWFYMPSMGLIAMLAVIIHANREWFGRHQYSTIVAVLIVLSSLSTRAILRSWDWRDGYTLFTTDIVHQQDSAHLQNNVGVEVFRRGQIQEAKGYFEKSIELNPYWKISWNNLGAVHHRSGNLKKAEECYRMSMQYGPYLLAYRGLAGALLQQDRLVDAKDFVEKALQIFPADPELLQFKSYIQSRP